MLEILMAVKNNNMGKIPSYDPEPIEQLKKTLKTVLKGECLVKLVKVDYTRVVGNRNYKMITASSFPGSASTESQLRISLDDLLQADNRGRWWMVGSAWTGKDDERKTEGGKLLVASLSAKFLLNSWDSI